MNDSMNPDATALMSTSGSRLEELRRLVDAAWERYLTDGLRPTGIRDEVCTSWQRARESFAIDPGLKRPRQMLSTDELEQRRALDGAPRLAAAVLRDFSSRADLCGHVLAFFDGDGWMLSIDGDRTAIERVAEIAFCPGANWSEASAGTNGPGTALAVNRPLEIFASEHYVEAWKPWSCAAAPVRSPWRGAPVGLVDITGPWDQRRPQSLWVAGAIARAIEERLRAAADLREEVVRHTFRALRDAGDALVAVDERGGVVALNDAASRRRLVEGGVLRPAIHAALAPVLASNPCERGSEVRLATLDGAGVTATPVRYDDVTVGAILRSSLAAPSHRERAPRRPHGRGVGDGFERILGRSAALRQALDLARTAAHNHLPVVLTGESGTGKELFARAIHGASERRAGRFVAVNCGAIPSELVEAELFGYEPGTFTGARRRGNPGRFEDADGGTLFLDEVSELSVSAQIALLRVLQEREVVRLGSAAPRPVDVRVIAATNKPLEEEIRARRFRQDLFYRLDVLSLRVPPLRERGDDLALLAQVFLDESCAEVGRAGLALSADALDALCAHAWPGNVRELRNVLLRAAATAPAEIIRASDLVISRVEGEAPPRRASGAPEALREAVASSEREALLAALECCSWNFARAAERLAISRMTLYRRLKRLGIERAGAAR
jgi:transcriptional regulator of acetoin/glycerol metabolism